MHEPGPELKNHTTKKNAKLQQHDPKDKNKGEKKERKIRTKQPHMLWVETQ